MNNKKPGSSWLTAVKRAFRSPSKEDDKKTSRRKLETTHDQDVDDEKKREKRRWLFRRTSSNNTPTKQQQPIECEEKVYKTKTDQQKHAIAVAAATTAAAEAAIASAKAAAEIIRLTKPQLQTHSTLSFREHHAAVVVQTVFRGYLARRALQALRGIVKLQAMVRGQNARKQTNTKLKYLQALLRAQAQARAIHNPRASHEATRNSMFVESTNFWDSRYMKDVRARKSTQSRAGSWIPEDWEDCPRTLDALLQARKHAALTRERSLAHTFSQQMWNYEKDPSSGNYQKELDEGDNWLSDWMETKQLDNNKSRYSYDRRESIKTLDVDSSKPYCYSSPLITRSQPQAPITPSPAKMKPIHIRASSPRAQREARGSFSTANTPSLGYPMPNYMAATQSAKAKVRSQSATRQRPSTPERDRGVSRDRGVRKRLSYPVHDMYCGYGVGCDGCVQKLKSPSFKSVQAGYVGMEQRSCYEDSVIGGEISPCSTTDLRRWLR